MDPGPRVQRVLSVALLGLISCTGQIGNAPEQSRPGAGVTGTILPPSSRPEPPAHPEEPPPQSCSPVTPQRARRLSLGEYERAVIELLGVPPGVTGGFAAEASVHGFDNQAEALSISSGNFEEFVTAAELAARAADVRALAPCEANTPAEACASSFIGTFAHRAYGRRLAGAEEASLLALYRRGAIVAGYETGVRTVVEAVLLSPYFLYRSEIGDVREGDAMLDPAEAANALAYALTGMRPDAELAARAERDPEFRTAHVMREEARRLLATSRSRQHWVRFLRGWLGVPDVRHVNKIPSMFPAFTPPLKAELDTEIELFLDFVLRDEHGTLEALLGAPVSFPSASILQTIYANDYAAPLAPPPLPAPGEFPKTALNPALRKGVLSLGGWLAAHGPVHRSSPVERGLAIRTRFFCQSLAPPPPAAVVDVPGPGDRSGTTRQKFERHTADPQCQSCHRLMDPIGFGLEMMDALGSFRTIEADLPVDSWGELVQTDVDGPFHGPAELADRLLASRQVRDCFVVQMFRYVEGRDERPTDTCQIAALQSFFATRGRTIGELAVELVASPRFLQRSTEP